MMILHNIIIFVCVFVSYRRVYLFSPFLKYI